jgi:nucleoside-diphosphate-sugar epimerase
LKILVTGATGFIGSAFCQRLQDSDHQVLGLVRSKSSLSCPTMQINDLKDLTADHLGGIDVVVHTAGLAHQKNVDPSRYQDVNVDGSIKLAKACTDAGVSRIISLSSTKAIGEGSVGPNTKIAPCTPYGESKLEAELRLAEIQSNSSIDIIQLRIPLTFGRSAKGNFEQLIKLTKRSWPLPLSALIAERHYLYIENLLDFIEHCLNPDEVASGCFFLADDAPVKLGDLLRALAKAQGSKALDFPIPAGLVALFCKVLMSAKSHQQIFQDCFVDSSETYQSCNWKPKYTTIEGIHQMFVKSL